MYSKMALWAIVLAGCNFRHGSLPADSNEAPDDTRPTIDAAGCEAIDVQAGGDHTCALTRDGSVYCWGRGDEGQIGVDPLTHRCVSGTLYCQRTPLRIELPAATAIGLGVLHSCAATPATAYCWGRNNNGQYGNMSTISTVEPTQVSQRSGASAFDGGNAHMCSLAGGAVSCAGLNMEGQVGNMSVVPQATAVVVKMNATAISVGHATSCAIDINRQLYCWGRNAYRTIDPNNMTIKTTPTVVPNIANVDSVAVGGDHLCAVSGGRVSCWGLNSSGQIGNGQVNSASQPQPITLVGALDSVVEVTAGRNHTCARTGNGDVYCWGEKLTPSPVKIVGGATKLTSGYDHDCAIVAGTVQCWGDQLFGQLGNNVDDVNRAMTPQLARICP